MRFVACTRCASLLTHPQTLGEGLVPGGGERMSSVCSECGFQGLMVEFDDASDYRAFRELKRGPVGSEVPAGEAARRAEEEAENEAATARLTDPAGERPRVAVHRAYADVFDRLRAVPLLAFAIGFVIMALSLTNLQASFTGGALAAVTDILGASLGVLIGLAFILIGRRAWKRFSGP